MILADYLEYWVENYCMVNLRPSTLRNYCQILRQHIVPRWGNLELDQLSPIMIQQYYKELLKGGKSFPIRNGKPVYTGEPMSPSTVLYHHRIMKHTYKDAIMWGYTSTNPFDLVKPPRRAEHEVQSWTKEECLVFLEVAKPHRCYPIYLVAILTGMRLGEILGLRWRDVDYVSECFKIQQILQKNGGRPFFGRPKTPKSRRQIAVSPTILSALDSVKNQQHGELADFLRQGLLYNARDLVFTTFNGEPYHPSWIYKQFKCLCIEAKVRPIRFHDLRHTHATLLLQMGINPKVVSERLGHCNIGITLDIYSHVLPSMQREAADLADEALFGKKE